LESILKKITFCSDGGAYVKKVNRFLFSILFCCLILAAAGWTGAEGAEIDAPSNLKATAVSDSQINLNWTDRSDNEKGFIIERRISSGSYAEIASLEPDTTAFADTGLLSGVTYSYRVKAYNDEGESAYSNVVSLSTGEAVPDEPGNLKATAVTSTRIDLTWTDRSYNEKGFKIERRTSSGSYSQIAAVGANATSYTSSGLEPGTRYYYRVCAYNDAGSSAYSNEANAITGGAVPDAPGSLTAKAVTSTRIDLSWTDRSDNEKGFKIERRTSSGSYSQIAAVGANATSYTSSGLEPGTRYYYRVCAYNDAGSSAYSNEANAITGKAVPNAPEDLEAVSISTSKIKLTWEDESDNEDGFKIERKKSGGSYSQIATVGKNVTTYTSSGLANDTRYYYRVRAYNEAGNSSYSNEASAVTGDDEDKPDRPRDLEAVSISTSKIKLTWEDESDNEDGFKIERKKSGGSYSQIATVGKNVTSYTNSGLANDTRYYYRVRAYNEAGNSSYSNEASAVTGKDETIIRLLIGDPSYYVNNKVKTMDTAPFIMEDRTLLPIRYVAEELGARVEWDNDERKVTITLEGTRIELWIERNYAMVDGLYRAIDEYNPNVKPIIVLPGRTMLPLRFIAENLGCQVEWDPARSEVTVIYPAP
jgi:fibronectin type 3 domain-containing protein